jgi:hypothetical protein
MWEVLYLLFMAVKEGKQDFCFVAYTREDAAFHLDGKVDHRGCWSAELSGRNEASVLIVMRRHLRQFFGTCSFCLLAGRQRLQQILANKMITNPYVLPWPNEADHRVLFSSVD